MVCMYDKFEMALSVFRNLVQFEQANLRVTYT